jgi:hypothetical protein
MLKTERNLRNLRTMRLAQPDAWLRAEAAVRRQLDGPGVN